MFPPFLVQGAIYLRWQKIRYICYFKQMQIDRNVGNITKGTHNYSER